MTEMRNAYSIETNLK